MPDGCLPDGCGLDCAPVLLLAAALPLALFWMR
jgi:hypothetical protein